MTLDFCRAVTALTSGLRSFFGRRDGAEHLGRVDADGLASAGVVAAVGGPCLMLVRRVLMTVFDIGHCLDMGTTGVGNFCLSSEGREGAICSEMGADGLCSSGVACTGELDFAFICSLLTIAFVLTGCNDLSFGG